MKQPLYNMTLERLIEDGMAELTLTSGFDHLDLIIKRNEKELVKVGLEVRDCEQLIEMLQLVLKHNEAND